MPKTSQALTAGLLLKQLRSDVYKVSSKKRDMNALERLMALVVQGPDGSYAAAEKAVTALKAHFTHWNEVRVSRAFEIADALSSRRIGNAPERGLAAQEYLRRVFGLQNHLELDWLYDASSERRDVLLDSIEMAPLHAGPVLDLDAMEEGDKVPVSTDLKRFLSRVGALPPSPGGEQVRAFLGSVFKGKGLFPNYVASQVQAAQICDSKHPHCRHCPVLDLCPYGKRNLGNPTYGIALEEMGMTGKKKTSRN